LHNKPQHILRLEGLGVSYGGVQAVHDVTFDVAPGEIVGLVGESGSGKSSILRALAGLLGGSGRISAGRAVFDGRDIASASRKELASLRGSQLAYVFQDPTSSLDPLFRIGDQFDECIRAHGIAQGEQVHALECNLLREMGFDDPQRVLHSYPHNLSGGMCQRVVLAFSVACNPRLLLADEPTSALDVTAQEQVSRLLLRIRAEHGVSMLVVSHNMGAISLVADRIGVMYRGRLVELGEREQVLHAPAHPYTRNLISAIPRTDGSLPRIPEHWEGE
jgi:peptide/nickel transport system ATP-binding protein